MELHEMGLNGRARVVGIDPCPIIEPDDGTGRNVVTGTMAHPGANIVYLDITGLDEPLGVTDTHPIWSETRQDFVVAGQLEIGEQFRTVTGQSATLTKIHLHRGPPEMVFNLEVDGQHVYHVASSGLLVHNDCIAVIGTRPDTLVAKDWAGHEVLDLPDWTSEKNREWVQSVIDRKMDVYKASPENMDTLWDSVQSRPRPFSEELDQLRAAGYVDIGDYLKLVAK